MTCGSFIFMFGGFDVNKRRAQDILACRHKKEHHTYNIRTKYPITEWELNITNEDDDVVRSYSGDKNPPASIIRDGQG